MSDQNRRNLTAFIATTLLLLGAIGHLSSWEYLAAPTMRTGIFFTMVWLAWQDLLRLPKFLWFFVPVILVAIVISPKMVFVLLGGAVLVWGVIKTVEFFSTPIQKNRKKPGNNSK